VYWARIAYLVAAWLFVGAVIVQVFLAGLSIFVGAANWRTHIEFGYAIGAWLGLPLLVIAFVGRIPRTVGRWLALLLAVYVIQTILPYFRNGTPVVAALHPVNAVAVFWVALTHARRAWALVKATRGTGVTSQQPVALSEH
jgi:hypothetical protein